MSTELVINSNGKAITNSLLVAKKFCKEHKHVLDAIRTIIKGCADFSADPMFEETIYVNEQNGQKYPMLVMNRDGFTLLAMGFNGKQAMQFKLDYISAFNKMEQTIKNSTMTALPDFSNPAEAARAWAQEYEQKMIATKRADEAEQQVVTLTKEIEAMGPKVSYYDMILQNPYAMPVTLIAKDYGDSAVHFNKMLKKFGIQYKVGKTWALYQDYADLGYVHYNVYRRGDKAKSHMCWTQKGRLFLYNFLKGKGIIPMIERQGMQVRMEEKINGESNIQED